MSKASAEQKGDGEKRVKKMRTKKKKTKGKGAVVMIITLLSTLAFVTYTEIKRVRWSG